MARKLRFFKDQVRLEHAVVTFTCSMHMPSSSIHHLFLAGGQGGLGNRCQGPGRQELRHGRAGGELCRCCHHLASCSSPYTGCHPTILPC
jgi:hypothetical protein